jgi:hypothetical protein
MGLTSRATNHCTLHSPSSLLLKCLSRSMSNPPSLHDASYGYVLHRHCVRVRPGNLSWDGSLFSHYSE